MTKRWLIPDQIYDGEKLLQGMALSIDGEYSSTICDVKSIPPHEPIHHIKGILSAGYLDLQVNGGGDVLLNNDPTPSAIRTMVAAHRSFGTVGILPTVITDAPDVLQRAVAAVIATKSEPGVCGIHIEGPHLSQKRRGTHAAKWVRSFEPQTLECVRLLRSQNIPVMLTVAPDVVLPEQISALAAMGAIVSLGHSDATSAQTKEALAAGATCFTHLFNAMSPMTGREPGMTGTCINSNAYAGFICDGIHVADDMLQLAIRARPQTGRMFVVSDAMSTVGGSERMNLYGQEVSLKDGRLSNAEGSLAGAHTTMAASLLRLIKVLGIDPKSALDMCIAAPSRLLALPHLAQPINRPLSDLVVIDDDWNTSPLKVTY